MTCLLKQKSQLAQTTGWCFPHTQGFGGKVFDHEAIPACTFCCCCCCFLFEWKSANTHQFHSLSQDQSPVAQKAEMTVAVCSWRVACELVSLIDTYNMLVYRSFWWKCSTSSCAVISLAVFIVVVIAAAVLFISDGGLRAFFRIPVCWSISRGKGGTQNAEGKE